MGKAVAHANITWKWGQARLSQVQYPPVKVEVMLAMPAWDVELTSTCKIPVRRRKVPCYVWEQWGLPS